MEVQQIEFDKYRARELYHEYRTHQHFATGIDREIARAYRLISQGRVVIRALESIRLAGLGGDGLPKLAIGRADKPICYLKLDMGGAATFDCVDPTRWRDRDTSTRFTFQDGTFAAAKWQRRQAQAPLIPLHLRPKAALDAYHLLWEADWHAIPSDPMLLRRIGHADLWLVVAAWDLTEVELAALSTRVRPQ